MFNAAASRQAADEAIDQVEAHAATEFLNAALAVVHDIARTATEFTTDRVWWQLDRLGVEGPREPRALGPIMRRAQSAGWIEDTGRTHLTVQRSAHRRPKRIWRSRLLADTETVA